MLADLHAGLTSVIETLSGGLHGGANRDVMEIDRSDSDPLEWIETALDEGRRIPGFGHRVYTVTDPRAKILSEKSEALGEVSGATKWYEMSTAIEQFVAEEKGPAPNANFYSALTYYQMGIPIDIYTTIFATSRVGGWIAPVLEQYDNNRLIRLRARYVGSENKEFVPIAER